MSLRTIRRRTAPLALLTLIAFWNNLLYASFARAQEAGGETATGASEAGASEGTEAAAVYDEDTQSKLSSHLEGARSQDPGDSAKPAPGAIEQDVDTALAGLPSGGGSVSAQATALPSGAATQLGMGESFTMQLSTGTAGFGLPLALPSARGTVQPRLDLSYSAAGGFGAAGVGWSIGSSAIRRQTDRGVPTYDDRASWHANQDRFTFGGIELVPICTVSGTSCTGALPNEVMPSWASGWQYFRARVEGTFMRFFWRFDHATWRVQAKDGSTLELGVPLDGTGYEGGLERNPEVPSEIFAWHLVRQYDAQVVSSGTAPSNPLIYRYLNDGNAIYLSDIYDTSPASDPTSTDLSRYEHHTRIIYEERPDIATSYRAGYFSQYRLRVARVDVTSKPWVTSGSSVMLPRELLRRYHLTYDPDSHRSLLSAVQLEGRCASPVLENGSQQLSETNCQRLPPVRLEYQRVEGSGAPLLDPQGYAFEPISHVVHTLEESPAISLDEPHAGLIDINADGLPDLLSTAAGRFNGKHGLFLNGLSDTGARGFEPQRTMDILPAGGVTDAGVLSLASATVAALDFDSDGIANLVHMPQARSYSMFAPMETAPGSGRFEWVGEEVATASDQDVKIDLTRDARNTRVMDVNGDGLVDFVYSSATELQTFFSLGRHPDGDGQFGHAERLTATTSDISNDPVVFCLPWSSTPVRFSDPDTQLADMNGDGLIDIVRLRSGQASYWPGRGNGFFGTGDRLDCMGGGFAEERHIAMLDAPRFGTTRPGGLLLSDINADGLSDLVELRANEVDIYLNVNGEAFTDRHTIRNTPFLPNDSNYARLTDIDGSGTSDILWGRAHEWRYIDVTNGVTPHLLTRIHNGLGKTTELEYASTTELMLDAQAAGATWQTRAPITMPVLVRTTTRDNLQNIGRPGGAYTTRYVYRDPVFEGRQREFRGFREVTVVTPGDANSPTSYQRSEFLLGECPDEATSFLGSCIEDNWREPLKGLVRVSEVYNDAGVYASSQHTEYALRQLYAGLDGRRVIAAFPAEKNVYVYDTTYFTGAPQTTVLTDVDVDLLDMLPQTEQGEVEIRAGASRLRSETVHDDFGNATESRFYGCVSGCPYQGPNADDEVITAHSDYVVPAGNTSGWMYREERSYVLGSRTAGRRNEMVRVYNARGDVEETYAVLSGTLPLDRFHASGSAIAPLPPSRSADGQILVVDHTYDQFGHVTFTRTSNNGCSSGDFDTDYRHLPTIARSYGGALNTTTQCGNNPFVHSLTYDRGLQAPVTSLDIRSQPASFQYDTFGRLIAVRHADPSNSGVLAPYPTSTFTYTLPSDSSATPYSITVVSTLDGATPSVSSYAQSWNYTDGLGRNIASLTPADPSAGDGGDWIVHGDLSYDAKGGVARVYDSWFHTGAPGNYSLPHASTVSASPPDSGTVPYQSREYDAFGTPVRSYNYDHQIRALIAPRGLATDIYDANDILPSPHQNTYATTISDGHGRGVERIERAKATSGGPIENRLTFNEYLPTGQVKRITHRAPGLTDVVRWLRYDSIGRLVLNVEPNTSTGFNPDPNTSPSTIRAHRYAYNDSGDMVGFSDARGCGANYFYDTAGRLTVEDRSPCLAHQAAYTSPNLTTGDNTEAFYRYDTADPESASVVDAAGSALGVDSVQLWGRLASVSGLGAKAVYRYDALGRSVGVGLRMQRPGLATATLSARYAPRWYIKRQTLDALDRVTRDTTGVTTPELLASDGTSEARISYTKRGSIREVTSGYGLLLGSMRYFADGRSERFTLGDATATQRFYSYDVNHRVSSVQSYRGNIPLWSSPPPGSGYTSPGPFDDPTQQLLLEDSDFAYDLVGNLVRADDFRQANEWPNSAKPASRVFEYDDRYRLTRTAYSFGPPGTTDQWHSPFFAENNNPALVQPSPHVSFTTRITEERHSYDALGNITRNTDDQNAFWDRSTGDRTHGTPNAGPHQLRTASNRVLAPSSPRRGDLAVAYDAAGNLTGLVLHRDGPCLPTGASCWQRFDYEWDEIGQLVHARRWDLTTSPNERANNGALAQPLPARAPNADLRYGYGVAGERTLKTATDAAGQQRHSVYVFSTLELRSVTYASGEYTLSPSNVSVRLFAGPATARVIHSTLPMPTLYGANQRVFLELSDQIGSTTLIIDRATGELVENSTYQSYGAPDSDYRPSRWQGFREPHKFSGKEDDIEVGLTYFGARYYSPHLGVWISPDPVTIHDLGSDSNPYAYASGSPLMHADPDGRVLPALAVFAIVVVVSAVISAGVNAGVQYATTGSVQFWGAGGVAAAFGTGLVAGCVGGAVGGAVSGAVVAGGGTALAGGILGGMAGGAAGGAAGYVSGGAMGGYDMTWQGFGLAMAGGALGGGIGGGVGAAVGPGFGGALAGGAAGGATDYVFNGATTGDWSVTAFAASMGSSLASAAAGAGVEAANAAHGAKAGAGRNTADVDSPAAETANAQKAPAGTGLDAALESLDAYLAVDEVVSPVAVSDAKLLRIDLNPQKPQQQQRVTAIVRPDAERPMVLTVLQVSDDGQNVSLRGVQIESAVEPHGNSASSTREQHLYEIYEIATGDVVKTGVSGQQMNQNGTSPRANKQVNALNRTHGAGAFGARLKQTGIPNRTQALGAERANANNLRAAGHSMRFHRRP